MTNPETTVPEARDIIEKHTSKLSTRIVPVQSACGYVLAEDVEATEPVQPFRNAAMDGYAVRYHEAEKANDVPLEIVGEVAAGDPGTIDVSEGECVGIMTGAPVPEELDTVVRIEDCEVNGDTVSFSRLPSKGKGDNVRNAGEDIEAGNVVLRKEQIMRPYEVGVAVLAGRADVSVHRRPKVAIISTGDELVSEPGDELGPGQVRDINRFTLADGARQAGADVDHVSSLPDDRDMSIEKIRNLFEHNDIVITSGGISMGEYDFMGDVLEEINVDFLFHKIWQKPGKPLGFGAREGTLFFALPGNVVSSMVNFEVYVRPSILKMRGLTDTERMTRTVKAGEELRTTDRRTFFFRGQYVKQDGELFVTLPDTGQGSHVMTSMSEADCLIEVPPETNTEPGDDVTTLDLRTPTPVPME